MVLRDIYNGMEEPLHDMGWLRPYGSDDFELLFFSDQGWKAPLTSPVKDAYVKEFKVFKVNTGTNFYIRVTDGNVERQDAKFKFIIYEIDTI